MGVSFFLYGEVEKGAGDVGEVDVGFGHFVGELIHFVGGVA